MTYFVLLHPKAAKALNKIEEKTRIKNKLQQLKTEPQKAGKQLKHCEYYSLRIGNYRAIYEINPNQKQIIILYIGHRKNVYDDLSKIF
ncbi:MAG: type II toxin-antitoxin system RelE family toxin [archaeon]